MNNPSRFLLSLLTSFLIGFPLAATASSIDSGQQPAAQPSKPSEPAQPQKQDQPKPQTKPGETAQQPPLNQQAQPKPAAPAPSVPFAPPSLQTSQPASLPLDEAIKLAGAQASNFEQARYAELIASEDVRQERVAFLPRAVSAFSYIYNSPAIGEHTPGAPREPSFISADAINAYEALVGFTGDIDTSGRLRATLRRNIALLEAARAGTEVARRALTQAVSEAYYGLSLAAAKRGSAELNLRAAEEFERITRMLYEGGEVAEVDLTRARLQTANRRDELEQARAEESAAADSLRVFVGYDFARPIAATELAVVAPDVAELDRFTEAMIERRPEFAQFEAERRAAEQEARIARADRLPQVSYFINGGFNTDSLRPAPLKEHSGALASISVTIPIFDWGASRSREQQARLRARQVESERALALRMFAGQFYTARALALSAAARVRTLQASVADAERNVQTSIARYRAGEAPILEVTDAQTTLATQRASLYQALFDYQVARARLAQAAGQ